ncbi:MAG: hypothetical protein V4794_05955 [Pseudomonadota bacterium]
MSTTFSTADALERLFRRFETHAFIFVEPGGNFGDQLIYWGAELLAERVGLSYRKMSSKEFLKCNVSQNEVVYVHVGGGYNWWCSGAVIRVLEHAIGSNAAIVIQGSCTFEEDLDYISDVMVPVLQRHANKEIYFMTREMVSYQLALDSLRPFCGDMMIAHDTAFRLTKDEVLRRVGEVSGGYRLYGFRQDNESGESKVLVRQLGIRMDPVYFCHDFVHWIRVHAGAK